KIFPCATKSVSAPSATMSNAPDIRMRRSSSVWRYVGSRFCSVLSSKPLRKMRGRATSMSFCVDRQREIHPPPMQRETSLAAIVLKSVRVGPSGGGGLCDTGGGVSACFGGGVELEQAVPSTPVNRATRERTP